MASLLRDPTRLRKQIDELLALMKTRQIDGDGIEALAECCFRLAMHPTTAVEESFDLLRRAFKVDGANPRYAYHLARLYFLHGRLNQAASWLELAYRLCPTSHRIWSHISLLQMELNAVYRGDDRYEPDVLRLRSEDISKLVKAGKDNLTSELIVFEPPPSRAEIERKKRHNYDRLVEDREPSEEQNNGGARPRPAREARRYLNANQCRWSGIDDLRVEQMLEAEPSNRTLRALAGHLQELVQAVSRRPGGVAGFAILAIEWIISGYPVGAIRRLRKEGPPQVNGPSLELLDLVCELYEADEEELPYLISGALVEGRIPPLLAALVHQRRLLWRPLEFRSVATYRAARGFLATSRRETLEHENARKSQTERANDYAKKLTLAVKSLSPKQPAPLEDIPPEEAVEMLDVESVKEKFCKLEKTARMLDELRKQAFAFLKERLSPLAAAPPDDQEYSQAVADKKAFDHLVPALKSASIAGLDHLGRLLKAVAGLGGPDILKDFDCARRAPSTVMSAGLGDADMPKGFNRNKEELSKLLAGLENLGNFEKALRRIDNQLASAKGRFSVSALPCSIELTGMLNQIAAAYDGAEQTVKEAAPGDQARALEEKPFVVGGNEPVNSTTKSEEAAKELTGLEALENAIERADREIARMFRKAGATFNAYSLHSKLLAPIRAIRLSVRAREAETYYRLGRRREARRIWSEILREDRLDVGALKNIAICDTAESDAANSLASWRSYAEAIYFLGIANDSPRASARERVEFHRSFSNAYAPAFLFEKLDNDWANKIDEMAFNSFIASPGRVRNFVEHKLLEFLNAKLDFTSPPLILGVSRSEGSQTRAEAKERLLAFAGDACALLPERVRGAFTDSVKRHVEGAFEACASTRRLTQKKDIKYPEEKDRQMQLLTDLCHLKYKLWVTAQKGKDFVKHMTSVEFLGQLARLDSIPLGQSHEFIRSVAGSLRIADPSELLESMKHISENVIVLLLQFIFTEGNDPEEDGLRKRQYRRLIDQWVNHPVMVDHLDIIDDPQHFYPQVVKENFQTGGPQVTTTLREWSERYPELTGPSRLLALILNQEKKFDEAIQVLDRVCSVGFHKERVTSCHYDRMTVWYNRGALASQVGNPDEAKRCLRQSLKDADYVIGNSKDEKEVEQAKKRKVELKQYI